MGLDDEFVERCACGSLRSILPHSPKMYGNERAVELSQTVGLTPKNLQVVSFDSEWKEIYLGTSRRDTFSAICPNKVPKATKFDLQYKSSKHASDTVVITSAKWCPMDNCTVLVLGCQFGMKLFDWDGSTQIFEYDFHDHGIGVDDRLVAGGMARGTFFSEFEF